MTSGSARPGYARGVASHHPLVPAFDRVAVPLGEVLDRQVELLREAQVAGDPVAAEVWRGTGLGADLPGSGLTRKQAELAIARDHGYADWAAARKQAGLMVDTRFEAAADAIQWGDLAAVRGYFGADGHRELGPALRFGATELPAPHLVEQALIQAASHGRREVVEFLLSKQPDLTVTEPRFGATARGVARHQGHTEIAALLES